MAQKRKPQDSALEELDRMVFQNFTAAANSISQLYASAEAQRRITFHAGEQHGLEKLRSWIFTRREGGSHVSEAEIISYLQNELGYTTGEAPMPLTSDSHQTSSVNMQMLTSALPVQNLQEPQGVKQAKTFGFTSAPSRHARGSPFHMGQGGLLNDDSPQVSQAGNNQMPTGNCLPCAFAQLDNLNQAVEFPDSLDSEVDMHIEDDPNQYY